MNIFVTSFSPKESAIVLPDKHINKMPLESCQMLAIVASKWYHNYGNLLKKDGNPYKTERGAFRNHPCTIWASKSIHNSQWLIEHGLELCEEFNYRFKKVHSCYFTLKKPWLFFQKVTLKKLHHLLELCQTNLNTIIVLIHSLHIKNILSLNYGLKMIIKMHQKENQNGCSNE